MDIPKVDCHCEAHWRDLSGGDACDALLRESARWTAAWLGCGAEPGCMGARTSEQLPWQQRGLLKRVTNQAPVSVGVG